VSLLSVALLATTPASGAVIDFETTPSGSPSSNDLVLPSTSAYTFPGLQVFFGFDSNSDGTVDSNAVFEHVGVDVNEPPDGGFSGSTPPMIDTPDPSDAPFLGQYFDGRQRRNLGYRRHVYAGRCEPRRHRRIHVDGLRCL
jgi:hypothetical protein